MKEHKITKGRIKKAYTIELELVPIEEDGVHMFIQGRINGNKARFLIDTGASRSVMDKERLDGFFSKQKMVMEKLEKLSTGLGTNTMESNLVILPILSFKRLLVKNYRMAVLDMSHVNHSYSELGMKKIDGVIGGDLLASFNAVIDYGKRVVILSPSHL